MNAAGVFGVGFGGEDLIFPLTFVKEDAQATFIAENSRAFANNLYEGGTNGVAGDELGEGSRLDVSRNQELGGP